MTYAEFVAQLAAIPVAGVKTARREPPRQVNDAEMPLSYPRLPATAEEIVSFSGETGLAVAEVVMVFLVKSMMLSTQAVNFAGSLAMIDAIHSAYRTAAEEGLIDGWRIAQVDDTIGETDYYALAATINASWGD